MVAMVEETSNRRGSVLSHEEISSFADEILGKIETQRVVSVVYYQNLIKVPIVLVRLIMYRLRKKIMMH
jgi:hypothetical protein